MTWVTFNVANPSETALASFSSWQQGATAARQGLPSTANPYHPLNYCYVAWHNGWASATHNIAIEENDL